MGQVAVEIILVVLLAAAAGGAALTRSRRKALAELSRGIRALAEGRAARPIQARAGGTVGRLARTFDEVAPQLAARLARLEADRQQLLAVLGGMTEGVLAVDSRRRLVFANAAAEALFGLGSADVGRLVAELVRSPKVQEAVEATLAGPEPHKVELTVPGQHGWPRDPERILALQGTPLPGDPPPGAVLVFHDVTELRRLERMRQDFVANASHELKTPLASIRAYTETLLDGALEDEAVNVRFLEQIDAQADRLQLLVQDLLSLARLESGQEPYRHDPMVLAPTVRAVAESHRARAEAQGLDFLLEIRPDVEEAVAAADEEAIRQILDNLIDNAIKYTPRRGRVRVALRAVDGQRLVIEVADTGIGIPRDDLPRVFERFYRVDTARSRELGGTGLGLSIVKHLVQSLGGAVTVDSRVGLGSTFAVRLPRQA